MEGISANTHIASGGDAVLQQMQSMHGLKREEQIKAATQQFEAVMLRQYLKEAMEPIFEGAFSGEADSAGIYKDMVTDAMANAWSERGGIGISHVLQSSLNNPNASRKQ